MPLEDFTTYTEYDLNNRLSETTTRVRAQLVVKNELCYLYSDKGAGYFGNFEFKLDVCLVYAPQYVDNFIMMCAVANALNGFHDLSTVQCVGFRTKLTAPLFCFILYDKPAGSVVSSVLITVNTVYYLRFKRSGTTLTLKIYSTAALRDAGGTPDIDTLTVNNCTTTTWQYIYGFMNWHYITNLSSTITYTENLDILKVKANPSSVMSLVRGMNLLQISKRFPKLKPRLAI